MMAFLGLVLASVGVDSSTGTARFTFGEIELYSGVRFVEVMIGLFAVGEVLNQVRQRAVLPIRAGFKELLITRDDLRRSRGAVARGTVIGFGLGSIPGAGSTLASFLAYGIEKRVSRNKDEFGDGAIEGVAAPEAANNAAANANFIPTLTLGIPGGATTAVLLGAFIIYGIQPGPLLFEQQPELVWGLLASFFIGNLILLVLNLPLAPLFAQILRVPYGYLYPLILLTSFVGAFSIRGSIFSVYVVLVAGIIGYAFKRLGWPPAPLVLGLVLGTILEANLVRTSAIGDGSLLVIFSSPIAVIILVLAAFMLFATDVAKLWGRRRSSGDDTTTPSADAATSTRR
jgi:putative tricarboxylic transport membrane protein